jgi:hypothetical protein
MFRKPSIADIYVKEVSAGLGEMLVPIYSPNSVDIQVGTIGRFVNGAFERRGHLAEIIGGNSEWVRQVPMAPPASPGAFVFTSQGSVRLEPAATVNIAGQDLLTARLSFTADRAVVVSFAGVVEQAVLSPRTFDDLLWKLYINGDLHPDEVVIWVLRRAASGTVLVNRKGGVDIELSADPALVAGVISYDGLSLGVKFGAGSSASYQYSGPDLTVAAKVKGLNRAGDDVATRRDFARLESAPLEDYLGSDVPQISAQSIVADADFSQGEGCP